MKKIFITICIVCMFILCMAAAPAYAADNIGAPTAQINGDVIKCNFIITSANTGNTEATLLAVLKSALVDDDLPEASALDITNVVYIDQKSVAVNNNSAFTFAIADEFKNEPIRVYIGAADATKVYVDVNGTGGAGVTVSGTVCSYNPKNPTTIKLVIGDTVKYETVIGPEDGIDQKDQDFSIPNVSPGAYSLIVTKAGHLSYIINNIAVANENVNIRNDARIASGIITLPAGDIINDGQIITMDLGRLIEDFGKAGASITDPLSDINGDGQVISSDLGILLGNYGQGNVIVP